jgi:DNA-binding NtrC family response regulator
VAKVLIVDDDPVVIRFLSRALRSAGHEVRDASEPKSGLRLAAAERFDVIILDNRFDNAPIAGIGFVTDFAGKAAAGVIMLTGYSDDELAKDAKMLGAKALLSKPIAPETLLGAVAELVAKGRP